MWFRKDLVALVPAALIFVPCLINAVGDIQITSRRLELPSGSITLLEAAIAEVREQLGGIDSVGYVLVRDPHDPRPAGAYYFITQYALAPIHVHKSRELQYTVGIFSSARERKKYLRSNDLKLLKTYLHGVALFEAAGSAE